MPQSAQYEVRQLFESSITDKDLVADLNLFHSSVVQKLWSTSYCCQALESLDVNSFRPDPPETATELAGVAIIEPSRPIDMETYCHQLNLFLDGFLMNCISVLDTLAHELSLLYIFKSKPQDIYIKTIANKLCQDHPRSRVGRLLLCQLRLPWYTELLPYRNCTTHESLIRYDKVNTSFDQVKNRFNLARRINLPDNPQIRPFTYNKRREATRFCRSRLHKTAWLVTKVYESILSDIHNSNSAFPIAPNSLI